MEINYQLQEADLENLSRHLRMQQRPRAKAMISYLVFGALAGAVIAFVFHWLEQENRSWFSYTLFILPLVLFSVSVIWLSFWQRSAYRRRWFAKYAGMYRLNPTPAGISYRAEDGRVSFYVWPEISGFEVSETDLYLYLRSDVAIPVPRAAFSDAAQADYFIEQVRDYWSSHPDNAGKSLPSTPTARQLFQLEALASNLMLAFRIVFFMNVEPRSFRVSFGLFLQLLILYLFTIGIVDYIDALPAPAFNYYGLNKFAATVLLMLGGIASISYLSMQRANMLRLLVMFFASKTVIHLFYFSGWLAAERWLSDFPQSLFWLYVAALIWTLAVAFRIIQRLYRQPAPSTLFLISIYAFFSLSLSLPLPSTRLYYNSEAENAAEQAASKVNEEDLYYRQPSLVAEELASLKAQRKGKTDLYFVGFAGEAEERVFFNDISLARNILDRRFNTADRSLVLVNNTDTVNSAPLANRHNLEAVLQGIAQRMDTNEDVLFLYFSSHGAKDHQLSVSFWPLTPNDLSAESLKIMLDNAGIKNRVIVVSACYSGGFLDVLKNDNTLVMTASSRDHVSYGCGDFTRYTYFSEAYFAKALANGDSFIAAFEQARELIEEREKSENLEASGPQIDVGRHIAGILQKLEIVPADGDAPNRQHREKTGLSFDRRVRQGRRFEQDATARDYAKTNVFPAMNTVMSESLTECLARPGASSEQFTLVADIQADGSINDVDFRPETNTAECFGQAFRTLSLPPLPDELNRLPVFFDMVLTE